MPAERKRHVYQIKVALDLAHIRMYNVLASDPISACELVMNHLRRCAPGDRFRDATEQHLRDISLLMTVDIEEHEVQPKMVTDGSPYR